VLRRTFQPKREEVTGDWRRLHNEELHNLCGSPNIIMKIKSRKIRWAWHVACMGTMRNALKILVEKPEGKRRGTPRLRWEDNIKIDVGETGWEVVDRMHVAQDRDKRRALVNTVMYHHLP
jgi:hypothetical protein